MFTSSSKSITPSSSDEEVQEMNDTSEFVHLLEPPSVDEEIAEVNDGKEQPCNDKQENIHEANLSINEEEQTEEHFMRKEDWETELAHRHSLCKWRTVNVENNRCELHPSQIERDNLTNRLCREEECEPEESHLKYCESELEQEEQQERNRQHENLVKREQMEKKTTNINTPALTLTLASSANTTITWDNKNNNANNTIGHEETFTANDNSASEEHNNKLVAEWEYNDTISSLESEPSININDYYNDNDNDVFFEPSSLIFAHYLSNDSESIHNENNNKEETEKNIYNHHSEISSEDNEPEVIDVESEDVFARFNAEDDEQSKPHIANNNNNNNSTTVPEIEMNNNILNTNSSKNEEIVIDTNHQPTRKRLRLNLSIDTSFASHINDNDEYKANSTNAILHKEREMENEQELCLQEEERKEKIGKDVSTQQEKGHHPTRTLRLIVPPTHNTDMVNHKSEKMHCEEEQQMKNEEQETKINTEECNNNKEMEPKANESLTIGKRCSFEQKQQNSMIKAVNNENQSSNTHTLENEPETSKIDDAENNKFRNNEELKLHSSLQKTPLPYTHFTTSRYRRPYSPNSPFPSPSPMLINSASSTPSINTKLHSKLHLKLPSAPIAIDLSTVQHHCVEEYYDKGEQIGSGTYGEVFIGRDRATNEPVAMKWLKTLKGLEGFPITSLREVIALKHIEKQRARVRMEQQKRLTQQENRTNDEDTKTIKVQENHTTTNNTTTEKNVMNNKNMNHIEVSDPLEEMISLRDVLLSSNESHDIVLVFNYAGYSIAHLLYKNFKFHENEVRYIFRKLVRGVAKLHEMGIIHRDIKADNVLLSSHGAVQLADFGLCVFTNSNRDLTPSIINLSYRPPEMLLGGQRYDEKVDIWSIGCLLAHFYLHKPPFYAVQQEQQQNHEQRDTNNNKSANNNNNNNKESLAEQHRNTELQQLAQICSILGPLSTVSKDAFSKANRHYLSTLQFLLQEHKQRKYKTCHSSSRTINNFNSNNTRSNMLANTSHILDPLFEESHCYCACKGFRQWFVNMMRRREKYYANYAILMPSEECVDVLCAIFQLDSRKRPTANELLQMPFFTNFIQEPLNHPFSTIVQPNERQLNDNNKNSVYDTNTKNNEAICESSVRGKLIQKLQNIKQEYTHNDK